MTCPVCAHTAEPAAVAGAVAICGHCGFTLHIDGAGIVTKAALEDIAVLTSEQMATLRRAKSPFRRTQQDRSARR